MLWILLLGAALWTVFALLFPQAADAALILYALAVIKISIGKAQQSTHPAAPGTLPHSLLAPDGTLYQKKDCG